MVVNASTDEVEQVNHYYAYGGIIGNLSSNEGLQEFKFGDKKLDRTYGLDLYDVEARQYDAITPWFTSIDPLAEKYYSISRCIHHHSVIAKIVCNVVMAISYGIYLFTKLIVSTQETEHLPLPIL